MHGVQAKQDAPTMAVNTITMGLALLQGRHQGHERHFRPPRFT
jgi:hypothetical protein